MKRLILIGMSGTGKSTVGREIADQLGWSLLSMDDELEAQAGKSIPEIFEEDGEPAFRAAERDLLVSTLRLEKVVISTGGGAVCSEAAWDAISASEGSLVVAFEASVEELHRRVTEHARTAVSDETTSRPMLAAENPLQRLRDLLSDRMHFYRRADVVIPVEGRSPERIAFDLVEITRLARGEHLDVQLNVSGAESRIEVGQGTRDQLARVVRARWPRATRLWIAVDERVAAAHGEWIGSVVRDSGFDVRVQAVPAGESSKSMSGLGVLYDWLLGGGVERTDVIVALGGGVVGDLAGFAAATTLRGIGVVQVPTTLLSMVDSSVGGKTGINHPAGKNLIGAFYQPPIVLVDPVFLDSLPDREYRSGFAEVIKHGVIQASTPMDETTFLAEVLRANVVGLLARREPLTSWVIRMNIQLKASVVEADEKEASLRQILNFGHTIGHGVEAAGYRVLHGEAIGVGMLAAMHIAVSRGVVDPRRLVDLRETVEAFGLPTSTDVDPTTVRDKMLSDKKKSGGTQRWVLPAGDGGVEIRTDVSDPVIDAAIASIIEAESTP